jgi:hypothetical protein
MFNVFKYILYIFLHQCHQPVAFPNYGEKQIGWIPEKDETIFKNV